MRGWRNCRRHCRSAKSCIDGFRSKLEVDERRVRDSWRDHPTRYSTVWHSASVGDGRHEQPLNERRVIGFGMGAIYPSSALPVLPSLATF